MAAIHVAALLSHPAVRSAIERALAARGNRGDTMLANINPREAAMLRFMGGAGTINPRTGLRQFYEDTGAGHDTGDTGQGGAGVGGSGAVGGGASLGGGAGSGTSSDAFGNSGLGGGVIGAVRDFIDRAAGNFGQGWGSQGVAGGYGRAGTAGNTAGGGGSGLGAGGGHTGQDYYSQTMYNTGRRTVGPAQSTAATTYTAPINNMPPAAPVTLDPMMSSTATTDLASGRFGALPSWATQPYQIGMAPSSYPTPGVNAAIGAPGTGGGGLPGGGGGGGGLPGDGGGGITPLGPAGSPLVSVPGGQRGVQLPGGTVALLNYNGPPAIGGGSINMPVLPNGQTLSQYLTSLRLGLRPNMPGAPVGLSGPRR